MVGFYNDVIGLPVIDRSVDRVALGFDEPVLVLEAGGTGRERDEACLFHTAFRVPDRPALARLLSRLDDHDVSLAGASDHGVSEALYLEDPEGNGIEIYRDRPREDWRFEDGQVQMRTERLDLERLRAEASGGEIEAMDVGHVHLEVLDLEESVAFYRDELGMTVMARRPGAAFLSDGSYHHYVGLNTWNKRRERRSQESRGLGWFEVVLGDAPAELLAETKELTDPSGFRVRPRVQNE